MNKYLVVRKKPKSKKDIGIILAQMEKIIDDKLNNLKVFTPILFTVVTSVIAFICVDNFEFNVEIIQTYLGIFLYALLCFAILIISLFGKSDYNATVRKTKKSFQPHKLSSYCHLSDDEYMRKLTKYAGRNLTYEECLSAQCIKQKANEYAFKKTCLNIVLGIVFVGVVILGLACLSGICFPDITILPNGGTT